MREFDGEAEPEAKETATPGSEEEAAAEETPDTYALSINVPTKRLADFLLDATMEDLTSAIEECGHATTARVVEILLQRKFDKLLEPRAVPLTATLMSSAAA